MRTMLDTKQRSNPPVRVPAPIGGWNTKDDLEGMELKYAPILENWWPTPTDCIIRSGSSDWSTGLSGTAETLMVYSKVDGTYQLFAITSAGNLYNVTAAGAVGAAIITGLSNGRWQYVCFATPAGFFILAFNGVDYPLRYNGTNWIRVFDVGTGKAISSLTGTGALSTLTTSTPHGLATGNSITVTGAADTGYNVTNTPITVTGASTFTYPSTGSGSSAGASYVVTDVITGIDPRKINNVNVHKSRIWLNQKQSLSQWYLPALAIQGAATEFPMGSNFANGGYLLAMGTWTVDAGNGVDDLACFFSSNGEVLEYKGTDPSSASTWAIQGLYRTGFPVGLRCQIKYGGDIYVITNQGVVPLSQSVLTAQVTESAAITDKIVPTMAAAVAANQGFGWELCTFGPANMLLINVPNSMGNYQFAMNTVTGAFTLFTGWAASTFAVMGQQLFFGAAGKVVRAWVNSTDGAAPIVATGLQAFYAANGVSQKKMSLVRPIIASAGNPSALFGINFDYDTQTQPTGALNFTPPSTGMIWGSMTWGLMTWGGLLATNRYWQNAAGIGSAFALNLIVQNNGSETHWAATDYVFEEGGVL